jgi:hypothetical protein
MKIRMRYLFTGSVTMEVQGEQHRIDAMLGMISVDTIDSKKLPTDLNEDSFEICD